MYLFLVFCVILIFFLILSLKKKFFSFLIIMEVFVSFISAFMCFSVSGSSSFLAFSVLISFLCFAVVEAVMGLAVLVSSSRCGFSSAVNSFSLVSF